jgi:hypothetical protein
MTAKRRVPVPRASLVRAFEMGYQQRGNVPVPPNGC